MYPYQKRLIVTLWSLFFSIVSFTVVIFASQEAMIETSVLPMPYYNRDGLQRLKLHYDHKYDFLVIYKQKNAELIGIFTTNLAKKVPAYTVQFKSPIDIIVNVQLLHH